MTKKRKSGALLEHRISAVEGDYRHLGEARAHVVVVPPERRWIK
tara:strand:- start:149 stop:280 length:132 start_codon:yes stop_codon:yes gene_type:complete